MTRRGLALLVVVAASMSAAGVPRGTWLTGAATTAEQHLQDEVAACFDDPVRYLWLAFPWGEPGPLLHHVPLAWQLDFFEELGDEIRKRGFTGRFSVDAVQMGRRSGHGIGKSALVGMLSSFILDTRPHSRGTVTANTGQQLKTKTFAQIAYWKRLALTSHWWDVSAGGMYVRHLEYPESWRLDAITWRKENTEAFAGQHAVDASSFYVFDEASAIDDAVWETAEGGTTDGEPFWFAFGNPTRGSGRFWETWHRYRHRWRMKGIDSRTVEITNKAKIQQWAEDYGEDSDFFRVRVKGEEPRAGDKQFIPHDIVAKARAAEGRFYVPDDAIVMGIDFARSGLDENVIAFRRGRDARVLPWKHFHESDSTKTASIVAQTYQDVFSMGLKVDAAFGDAGGLGGPICDNIRKLGIPIIDVNGAWAARRSDHWHDKTAEMWGDMKQWLMGDVAIPDEEDLASQLTAREYDHDLKARVFMEPKDELKERGYESPDRADALALTFANPVFRLAGAPGQPHGKQGRLADDYDPWEKA